MCIPHSVLYLFLVVLIRIMFFTQWRAFISWQSFSLFKYVKKKIEKKAWSVITVSPLHCKVWTIYTRVQLKGLLNVHVTLWLNCLLSQWDASVDLSLVQISVLIPPPLPPWTYLYELLDYQDSLGLQPRWAVYLLKGMYHNIKAFVCMR